MHDSILPLLIEPEDLVPHLESDNLLIVDLSSDASYLSGHIPGAVFVRPAEIVLGTPPAPGKLPTVEQLNALFSRLGLKEDTHVVAYDDEGGGWAGRFIWTLDVIGHKHSSYLNGGIHAWRAASLPLSQEVMSPAPVNFSAQIDESPRISKQALINALDAESVLVWDARSPEEYHGQKMTAQRNGHMPGAVNGNWLDLMDRHNQLRLRTDLDGYLNERGLVPGQPIVTHCQSHHRSGLTYLVGKLKGLDIRAYDGSWSEWGNSSDTPIV